MPLPLSASLPAPLDRRTFLRTSSASVATLFVAWAAHAQTQSDTAEAAPQDEAGQPFSFDWLDERMRAAAQSDYEDPEDTPELMPDLDYDDYRQIQFDPKRARWREADSLFHLHAFHPGWLYKQTVAINEVVDGTQTPITFSTEDFLYYNDLAERVPANADLPGVAGFRINTPLNRADLYDELISFVGASYFRALARGNSYGLSARGLAINTGLGREEEFPRFTEFWLERPAPGQEQITLYAALDSPSCTGAYRFVVRPGSVTTIDVTARLHFRREVEQLGLAALTSMFLFDEKNASAFDDYRPQVHDSNALMVMRRDGDVLWRPLNNPPRLASTYLNEPQMRSFGLIQRDRTFADYQDAEAHYQDRPSVMIEPQGDWGEGMIRLIEIPSDLEGNDNIVSYWVPRNRPAAGDSREYSYRLTWGALDTPRDGGRAWVVNTLAGQGGTSGVEGTAPSLRKFVVDFDGGLMARLPADAEMEPIVTVTGGEIEHIALSKIENTTKWRLVIDVDGENEKLVELVAHVAGFGRKLTETWIYQWIRP